MAAISKNTKTLIASLADLPRPELIAIAQACDEQLKAKEAETVEEMKRKVSDMATEMGLPLDILRAALTPAKGAKGHVPIKYRNPKNSEETWTGRGRQPNWLAHYIESGGKLTDCALPGA